MEYDLADFDRLPYPVHRHDKDLDVASLFPIFRRNPSFLRDPGVEVNRNYLIRYIIFTFSFESPLQRLDDFDEARYKGAALAGFPTDKKGHFIKPVEDIIMGKNEIANEMICMYCMTNSGDDFSSLNAMRMHLRSLNETMMRGGVEGKNKELVESANQLRTQIKTLRDSIFSSDNDLLLQRSIYKFMEMVQLKIMPEDYALSLSASEYILDDKQVKG